MTAPKLLIGELYLETEELKEKEEKSGN